jgi:predicted alpha/beta superfamily hydrolase
MRIVLISFLFLFANTLSYSQASHSNNVVGENYTLQSDVLNEERDIQVYLPPSYGEDKDKSYPVLYLLDGQEYFMAGVAYQHMLMFRDKTPEFIVIGVNTERRKRRTLFYEKSVTFIGFLEKELIPFVDEHFRTMKSDERIFFGWEMAAGLGLEILGEHSDLFSAYLLASPTHANRRMEALNKLNLSGDQSKFLLITAGLEEGWILNDSSFNTEINNLVGVDSRVSVLEREDHYTTPLKTIHEGLSDYFHNYKPIRYYTLKEYDNFGGLEALKKYYLGRGKRFRLSTDIHEDTKHFLILNAQKEDNFIRFEEYVKEFDGYLESFTWDVWFNRYGQYYLQHDELDKAIAMFQDGLVKLPKSALLYSGLGDVQAAKGKKKKALEFYKKALTLDPHLESLSEKIESLSK